MTRILLVKALRTLYWGLGRGELVFCRSKIWGAPLPAIIWRKENVSNKRGDLAKKISKLASFNCLALIIGRERRTEVFEQNFSGQRSNAESFSTICFQVKEQTKHVTGRSLKTVLGKT